VGRARSPLPRRLRAALLVLLAGAAAGVGCDAGFVSGPPPSTCSETGAQCRLPEGPLGVCERTPCPEGEEPPCFVCTPQH